MGDHQLISDHSILLQLENVSVIREETWILRSISAKISRGQHHVILGPNGAGKTSLLKVLLRHFYPSIEDSGHQGTVTILGQTDWEVSQLRKRMGVLSTALDQSFASGRTGRMTASQAVASGFHAVELAEFGPAMTAEMKGLTHSALAQVGMHHLAGRLVQTMSTGERRRVLIARALVHDPEILVLDEPTTGLDMAARHSFLEIIRQIIQTKNVTLVLVTHHIEEILPEIEYMMLLDQGSISFAGLKVDGLTEARLSQNFGIPIRLTPREDGYYGVTT